MSIDNYVADLNVLVDQLDGAVDLVGLCQGGWMALIYAARFPTKVRKLVLAGAPIDIAAGKSTLSELAAQHPHVRLQGAGRSRRRSRFLGQRVLQLWDLSSLDRNVDSSCPADRGRRSDRRHFRRLEARFHEWYAWTVDLPGTYYLQVGRGVVHGKPAGRRPLRGAWAARSILPALRCPLFLLAARDDDVVAPEQIFATEHLVNSRHCAIEKATAPCGHLGLFMGREILAEVWPEIARWLLR